MTSNNVSHCVDALSSLSTFHFYEAERLGGPDGDWRCAQTGDVPVLLARAQVHASIAVVAELQALRLMLGGEQR